MIHQASIPSIKWSTIDPWDGGYTDICLVVNNHFSVVQRWPEMHRNQRFRFELLRVTNHQPWSLFSMIGEYTAWSGLRTLITSNNPYRWSPYDAWSVLCMIFPRLEYRPQALRHTDWKWRSDTIKPGIPPSACHPMSLLVNFFPRDPTINMITWWIHWDYSSFFVIISMVYSNRSMSPVHPDVIVDLWLARYYSRLLLPW